MRFPKETVAAIHDSKGASITVRWPAGREPEKGGVYYLASEEDAKDAQEGKGSPRVQPRNSRRRSGADAQASLRQVPRRLQAQEAPPPNPPSQEGRPADQGDGCRDPGAGLERHSGSPRRARPVRHTGLKTRVPAQQHPTDKEFGFLPTELESEEIVVAQTRREREDEEESLKVESAASADSKEVDRLARRVADQKRRGKPSRRTELALERARKRVVVDSAGEPV